MTQPFLKCATKMKNQQLTFFYIITRKTSSLKTKLLRATILKNCIFLNNITIKLIDFTTLRNPLRFNYKLYVVTIKKIFLVCIGDRNWSEHILCCYLSSSVVVESEWGGD